MTLDDAIVAFGQMASDDFDSLELDVRDYERLVKWLTELKLARESAFSDIGLAARAVSENNQLKDENRKLREFARGLIDGYECGRGELCEGCTWDGMSDPREFSCKVRAEARELGVTADD